MRSFWTWSRESPKENCKVKTGSTVRHHRRLLLKNRAYLFFFMECALAENQVVEVTPDYPDLGVLGPLNAMLTLPVCRDAGIVRPDPRHSLRPRT